MPLLDYTSDAVRVARLARCRAARAGAKKVEPEHLLLALLARNGVLARALMELGTDPVAVLARAKGLVGPALAGRRSSPRLSGRIENVLLAAEVEARPLGRIDVRHVLQALVLEGGPAAMLLEESGADYESLRRGIRKALHLPPPAHCASCGYDLRATPDRCPECGRLV